MNDKTTRNATIVLAIGIVLILLAPIVFTQIQGWVSFENTGQIGDTIGGITAPIASLVGSTLVYFALKAQIDANNLVFKQIEESKKGERERRDLAHISELYKYFTASVEDFELEEDKVNYKGVQALLKFFRKLHLYCVNQQTSSTNAFMGILTSLDLLLTKLENAEISKEDKLFYKQLIRQLLEYKIFRNFNLKFNGEKEEVYCHRCNQKHESMAFSLSKKMEDIKTRLKTIESENIN
jgi:hypothetical protein